MTGLELLKAPEATAGEIADIISSTHNALWNWAGVYTWCQETYSSNTSNRARRGCYSARYWFNNLRCALRLERRFPPRP